MLAAVVAVGAVVAVVLMAGSGNSPDKKGPTETSSTLGSPSPSLSIPSELPSKLPSSLPSELPSGLRSILPSDLQSLIPTLADGAVP
ncbi:hypothetical protein OG762_41720 [Streptomyces sp. NBC_01136]|uniref:hypothetical protein n=1 Tax=Streptomyces sp. NBC_01136 TaxID=2903754 RepID=UPI00386ED13C|nr:hypothetical protein OG762_41720 [Streptomyces sp. NBC_01136]